MALEMKEAEMKESLAKDFGRASDKSPFRAKQIRTGSEADGDDDFMPVGWEKEMSAQMEVFCRTSSLLPYFTNYHSCFTLSYEPYNLSIII